TVAFTANSEEKGAPPPSSYPSKSPAVDLYSLTESVAKRARDLDMADLRLQEERKLLEKVKEEVRQQIALLDRKLAELSKRAVERDKERRAARQYLARVFRAMEAEDAAKRLRILGERETALILRELKEKDAAKILARMEPGFAASVAQKMEKD
ncbi:MAG: hypothetical protein HZA60_06785, partial [Deltaproteobacteria bacterium]|nr:hypothetical protein [Deltaproteobacteria bacterium]